VRLQQLEDRQVEAERAVQEHQIYVAVDPLFQRVERVADADVHKVGQACGREVFPRALRFRGF
jgi:hypothetical protein